MSRLGWLAAAWAALTLVPKPARAHDGPPFPIVSDRRVGPYLVSVWTDPDIGTGTFYVIIEAPPGAAFPAVTGVRVAVRPESGRLAEAAYQATPQDVRRGARYLALVSFDRGEWWQVRVVVEGAVGGGEIDTRVEATPAGIIGPIGLLLYSLPFVAVGGLWLRAVLVRRRAARPAGG